MRADQLTPPKKLPGVPENHTTARPVPTTAPPTPVRTGRQPSAPGVPRETAALLLAACSPVTQFHGADRHRQSPYIDVADGHLRRRPVVSNTDQTSIAPDPAEHA